MNSDEYNIPDWCPLTDLQEILDMAKFEHGMVASKGRKEK